MSELSTAKSSSASTQWAAPDDHALAQVEKWMAMIREMGSKPRESRVVDSIIPGPSEARSQESITPAQ